MEGGEEGSGLRLGMGRGDARQADDKWKAQKVIEVGNSWLVCETNCEQMCTHTHKCDYDTIKACSH